MAAALQSARRKNGQVSLRDGIYCELYATVLPTFTQTRAVCDRALFLNVLSPDRSEIIAASDELSPSALNVSIVRSDLQAHGFNLPKFAPFFVSGEVVQPQGFAQSLTIAGAVALHEAYQLYACEGDAYLLLLEPNFAAAMCNAGLLWPHELLNLRVDRAVWRAQVLSKRYAVESLNDRHFGLTLEGAAALALAMQRTRDSLPQADLSSGLYLAQRGIILCPSGGGSDADDGKLYAHILHHGPFAQAPLNDLAIKVLTRLVA